VLLAVDLAQLPVLPPVHLRLLLRSPLAAVGLGIVAYFLN